MNLVTVARAAMATRFEIVLHGRNEPSLRAAAEAALDEIDRVEEQLSFYRATSHISDINARAAAAPVRVDPAVFDFLEQAKRLQRLTGGAFDLTIGPLMRCWGFTHGSGQLPSPSALKAARDVTGMHLVELNPSEFTVRFQRPGVLLDPGAIGKGYAIECAVEILAEAGIENGLIHGGTSTVRALGSPPDADTWRIALPRPDQSGAPPPGRPKAQDAQSAAQPPLTVVALRDNAMSVSAVWGKSFEADGRTFGHVLDPRLGEPICGALMTAVITRSATEADALSTALLVLGASGQAGLHETFPELQSLVISRGTGLDPLEISARGDAWSGIAPHPSEPGR
jgi:FAD:protein FMN transferase